MAALNVFQPCASLSAALFGQGPGNLPDDPAQPGPARNSASPARAAAMQRLGILRGDDLQALADDAQRWLNKRVGLLPEANGLQPLHHFLAVPQAICVTYANAYGRFAVTDALAGYSFAAIDASGRPVPLPAAAEATLYGLSTGIPPTAGIAILNDRINGGREDRSSTPDQNLDGVLALYRLVTGRDLVSGAPVEGLEALQHRRIRLGIEDVQASGRLRGVPAIIVNGRADAVVAPNHAGRGYLGLNRALEGEDSRLSYCEVVDAHHFDAWNGLFPVLAARYVPLQPYLERALDRMLDHLRTGRPLPPSQVIRSRPRGVDTAGSISPLDAALHLPPLSDAPGSDAITYADGRLAIPD
jgi:hydroxybutyrate-dimer hydrolase